MMKIVKCGEESSCADVKLKSERRVMKRHSGIPGGDRQVARSEERG